MDCNSPPLGGRAKRCKRFHQKEDFTNRIRNTLEDYNCDNWRADGVVQEFLANADDAGATEFALIYDDNEYGTSRLLSEGLAEWQGPSLCIFNDAYFEDVDWDSIRKVGTSQKRKDETKIGRFGLGVLTGYCCTDVIQILSGNKMVILDPHQVYLENDFPGVVVDLEEYDDPEITSISDQLSPFTVLGTFKDPYRRFEGTMFRLPLRNDRTAQASQIMQQTVADKDLAKLFRDFIQRAKDMIMFTRSIKTIKGFYRARGNKARQLLEVTKETESVSSSFLHRPHTAKTAHIRVVAPGCYADNGVSPLDELEIKERQNESWLVVSRLQPGSSSPKAEVAAKTREAIIDEDGLVFSDSIFPEIRNDGLLYCFMPLPFSDTGLPIHINGQFLLQSNRRNLWSDMDDEAGRHNLNILTVDVPPLWIDLLALSQLEDVRRGATERCMLERIWPPFMKDLCPNPLKQIVPSFAELVVVGKHKVLFSGEPVMGKWISFPEAVFEEKNNTTKAVVDVAQKAGINFVYYPKRSQQQLSEAAVKQGMDATIICPSILQRGLKGKRAVVDRAQVDAVLSYLLPDGVSAKNIEGLIDLHDLELVPLKDGGIGVFQDPARVTLCQGESEPVYYVCSTPQTRNIPKLVLENTLAFVDPKSSRASLLASFAEYGKYNIEKPGPLKVAEHIPNDVSLPAYSAWLKTFWKHMKSQKADVWTEWIHAFSEELLVPVNWKMTDLVSITDFQKYGIGTSEQKQMTYEVESALERLGLMNSAWEETDVLIQGERSLGGAILQALNVVGDVDRQNTELTNLPGRMYKAVRECLAHQTVITWSGELSKFERARLQELKILDTMMGRNRVAANSQHIVAPLPFETEEFAEWFHENTVSQKPMLQVHTGDEVQKLLLQKCGIDASATTSFSFFQEDLLPTLHTAALECYPQLHKHLDQIVCAALGILGRELGHPSYDTDIKRNFRNWLRSERVVYDMQRGAFYTPSEFVRTSIPFFLRVYSHKGARSLLPDPYTEIGICGLLSTIGLHTGYDEDTIGDSMNYLCHLNKRELATLKDKALEVLQEASKIAKEKDSSWIPPSAWGLCLTRQLFPIAHLEEPYASGALQVHEGFAALGESADFQDRAYVASSMPILDAEIGDTSDLRRVLGIGDTRKPPIEKVVDHLVNITGDGEIADVWKAGWKDKHVFDLHRICQLVGNAYFSSGDTVKTMIKRKLEGAKFVRLPGGQFVRARSLCFDVTDDDGALNDEGPFAVPDYLRSFRKMMLDLGSTDSNDGGGPVVRGPQLIGHNIADWLDTEDFMPDLEIMIDGRLILAHRCVLCVNKHIFTSAKKEWAEWTGQRWRVDWSDNEDMTYDVAFTFLKYLYFRKSEIISSVDDTSALIRLLKISELFMDEELKKECEVVLSGRANKNLRTSLFYFNLARTYRANQLREVCKHYIKRQWRFLKDEETYMDLPSDVRDELRHS